jgi:hypothetical protein
MQLKAPFPYFGGKRQIAKTVWQRLGNVGNYIEPFCGSAALLWLRPHEPRIETINDADCMVANFWRSTQADPLAVARHCNWPVNEADLHARHHWLIYSDEARALLGRMRIDPDYYDARIAGWWCWGLCCWIGSGWCHEARHDRDDDTPSDVGPEKGENDVARSPLKQQMPDTSGHSRGRGVHGSGLLQQIPDLASGCGVHSIGRGVHGCDAAGTCAEREAWLVDWFGRLRDRLRTVRVCCGDWERVCGSRSVTTRIGMTAVFMDPPYSLSVERMRAWVRHLDGAAAAPEASESATNRDGELYASDSEDDVDRLVARVHRWAREHGNDRQMRIALCGYAGEHDELEAAGWDVVSWKADGGYANRGGENVNRGRERVWFSRACQRESLLFDAMTPQRRGETEDG